MTAAYGYIKGTLSEADGDHVDVFVSDKHLDSDIVFIVNQNKADGSTFDEVKCMLGCISSDEAKKLYLSNYSKGWTGFGSIVAVTIPQFKRWLQRGDTSRAVEDEDVSIKTGAAWTSLPAGVPGLVADEGQMPQSEEQAFLLLRGSGDQGLCKVAEELLGVLRGYGTEAFGWHFGTQGQRQGLQLEELLLGDEGRAGKKQAEQHLDHVPRQTQNPDGLGEVAGNAEGDTSRSFVSVRLVSPQGFDGSVKSATSAVPNTEDSLTAPSIRVDPDTAWCSQCKDLWDECPHGKAEVKQKREKKADDDHPFTIAVDLDGTIAEQKLPFDKDKIEKPRRGAKKWMTAFHEAGARLIIFTVRGDEAKVKAYLKEHEIPYDHVNENPDQPEGSSGKVYADAYWDDRGWNAKRLAEHAPTLLAAIEAKKASLLYVSPAELLHLIEA